MFQIDHGGPSRSRHILVGHLSWDTQVRVERIPSPDEDTLCSISDPLPGGAAGNVAAALALSGADVSISTRVGIDGEGSDLATDLGEYGVALDLIRKAPNTRTTRLLVVMNASGERSFYLDTGGASFGLSADDVLSGYDDGAHLIFAGCSFALANEVLT